jgi:tetratricopeptide (TPR) repeat protein
VIVLSRRSLIFALFCACLIASASSCAFLQQVAAPSGREKKVIDDTAKQAQTQVALGDYAKALTLYAGAYDKYHYRGMGASYARLGEQIRNAADVAYQKKDFAEAGNIYKNLLESRITARDFAKSLSFNDDYLSGQISACSKSILELGLMKYREEKLDEAVAIWMKALDFDPDNKGIKDAIETAAQQSQQLKSLK